MKKTNLVLITLIAILSQSSFSIEVTSPDGRFNGNFERNAYVFKNIPFAKPPVGELRWKAPRQLDKKTTNRNRNIIKCAQLGSFFSGNGLQLFDKPVGSEDCLYLNISTPKNFKSSSKKPVFVWLYGGSNRAGYASDPLYHGANLAAATDAVIIAVNYRLGHFGGFYNTVLHGDNKLDNSGNFVTLDALAALNWIHKNIDKFGGDKSNITVGGQSAGCINVWGLIMSPLAKNKFKRAYCSAGFPNNYPKEMANEVSNDFISNALISKKMADNKIDARRLIYKMDKNKLKKFLMSLTTSEVLDTPFFGTPVQHISDGVVFPHIGLGALATGGINKVDFMTGANSLEGSYFLQFGFLDTTKKEYWNMINGKAPLDPFYKVINSKEYKKFRNVSESLTTVVSELTDYVLHTTQFYFPKIYRYEFDWKSNHEPWRSMYGSTHGIELPFLFRNFDYGGEHFMNIYSNDFHSLRANELSDTFSTYIKGFLHSGNPNQFLSQGKENWLQWQSAKLAPNRLIFGESVERTEKVYPNPLIGMEILKTAGHILTNGFEYRPKN